MEAVNGRLAAQVTQAARYAGPLLIVLVSASHGSAIGVTASTRTDHTSDPHLARGSTG